MNNILHEIKQFKQYVRQLSLLLDETNKSILDLNALQIPLSDTIDAIQSNYQNFDFIHTLNRSSLSLIINAQNTLAKSIIINELLGYTLLPYVDDQNENWKLIRIKNGKSYNFAYHLIDSEFELMNLNNENDILKVDDLRVNTQDNSIVDLKVTKSKLLNESNIELVCYSNNLSIDLFNKLVQNTVPIYIYGLYDDQLSDKDLFELSHMDNYTIFFIKIPQINTSSQEFHQNPTKFLNQKSLCIHNEDIIFILKQLYNSYFNQNDELKSELCDKWSLFMNKLSLFIKKQLRLKCIQSITRLFEFHEECLNTFINYAYDCARDMQFTPRKIEYAKDKEQVLYETLNNLTSIKQEELKTLIGQIINTNRVAILEQVREYQIEDGLKTFHVRSKVEELVMNSLNTCISRQLTESIQILKENYIGTLKRCLETLEDSNDDQNNNHNVNNTASEALKQIVQSAYQIEVMTPNTTTKSSSSSSSSSNVNLISILMDKIRDILRSLKLAREEPLSHEELKIQIANNMISSLSEAKLARLLSIQMKERLKQSHAQFTQSMKLLEAKHTDRLSKAEEIQYQIRKSLAPKFAKLCLESTSLRDLLLNGMPVLGKELGRGQYGVVYSCVKWGLKYTQPVAIKSVVPPDEKHWNDLALEFHYTKSITDHERIVKLLGSVIDYTYANGSSPAVLLIMEQMKSDLHGALKQQGGLEWQVRVQLSIDVVEGIRYLHGRGLVHRDIKLKNVLLDTTNRAKITDLGFCKPEAMMSGSIVGTPVHMAPEVFNNKYDNSIDIYAFGILFWYICSNSIKLPSNYESCLSKDDLWQAVKRGKRPERLLKFNNDCWFLMESCWKHEPKERPHIGEVYNQLIKIQSKYQVQ